MSETSFKTIVESIVDLEQYVGKEVGLTDWMTIDQSSIDTFGALTKDNQWIHTDPKRCAEESPFKRPIAHGFLVLSFASYFAESCFEVQNAKMGMNYGFDRIRFTNVVPVDGKLRGRLRIIDLQRNPENNSAKVKIAITFEIQGQEKPAIVAEWIAMLFE